MYSFLYRFCEALLRNPLFIRSAVLISQDGGLGRKQRALTFLQHCQRTADFFALIVKLSRLTVPGIELRAQTHKPLAECVVLGLGFRVNFTRFPNACFLC